MKTRKTPVLPALLADILIFLLLCGILAAYYLLRPKKAPVTPIALADGDFAHFALPVDPEDPEIEEKLTSLISAGKKGSEERTVLSVYADSEKELVLTECRETSDGKTTVWFVCDLYLSDMRVINTNVVVNDDGTLGSASVKKQAGDSLLAMTGDTFSMSSDGLIVRNGVVYRSDLRTANDICLLCCDGSMKILEKNDGYTEKDLENDRVWQAFTFGPSLLDRNGTPKKNFNIAASHLSDLSNEHPRTALGIVSPGHYVLLVLDGRGMNGSSGATFPQLARIMANEGCTAAYNLDGGRSSVMICDGRTVNDPYKGGRPISDTILIGREPYGESEGGENE